MSGYPAAQIDRPRLEGQEPLRPPRLACFTGRYDELLPAQREAILELTTRRFVEEVFHLDDYLGCCEHLQRETPEFTKAYNDGVAMIRRALANDPGDTYISAILLRTGTDHWFAMAAMRAVPGRQQKSVADTIGQADSAIPTHNLLRHLEYPCLPDFDPRAVFENQVFCISRLVAIDQTEVSRLAQATSTSGEELQSALATAFSRLIATLYRIGNAATDVRGWIFNVEPKLACVLKTRKGLNLVPLFAAGVEPTQIALDSPVYGPHFRLWRPKLQQLVPDVLQREGICGAIRHLASQDIREWRDCEISLPYLLVNNAELEQAIEALEADLRRRGPEVAIPGGTKDRSELARVCRSV